MIRSDVFTVPPPPVPDEPLLRRATRFTATVTTPVMLVLLFGAHPWLVYALVGSIVSFAADTGGTARERLNSMAIGAGALCLGGAVGTLAEGRLDLILIAFALAGALYAMTESLDALALTASRFLCFGVAIGALYHPLSASSLLALWGSFFLAWCISLVWDAVSGAWRPSHAPHWPALWAQLRATRMKRWPFALAVAIATPLAYLASASLGITRPYWAMLSLVLVLRVDFLSSRKLMVERFLGTVLGVAIAGAYVASFSAHKAILAGIVAAALARWPAEQRHGTLGVAALTAFVMLVLALVSTQPGEVSAFLKARVVDTVVGCAFALLALMLDRAFRWVRRRWQHRAPARS